METLKFLMVSSYYPPFALGGDAYLVKYLSEELARRGHEVHVLYNPSAYRVMRAKRTPVNVHEAALVTRHEHECRNPKSEIIPALIFGHTHRSQKDFEAVRGKVRPDVVHWHNTRGFIGEPIHTDNAVNLATAHDYYMICPRSNLLRPDMTPCDHARLCSMCSARWGKPPQLWRLGKRRVLRPDGHISVISPSEFLASRLRLEGIDVRWVLRNFVPDSGARTPAAPEDGAQSIVYLGMLEPHKGVTTLVKSFINTMDRQGFSLVLVGDGSLRGNLEKLVHGRPDLKDRIHVKGFISREELDTILSRATMQVIPSEWYENAPLVALEALSRGIPTLASDMGGLPEILTPDTGSILFAGGDTHDLERKLITSWERRDEMTENGKKARAEYERRYTPASHISEYTRVIGRTCDQ